MILVCFELFERVSRIWGQTMPTSTIPVRVDEETARAYSAASADDRKNIQLLLGLRLRDLTLGSPRTLDELMDDISRKAEARGLTQETLESLLQDE